MPYLRVPLPSDRDARESQIQWFGPRMILDEHNPYALIFPFRDSKQAVLYGMIQLIRLVKSHSTHMSLKL